MNNTRSFFNSKKSAISMMLCLAMVVTAFLGGLSSFGKVFADGGWRESRGEYSIWWGGIIRYAGGEGGYSNSVKCNLDDGLGDRYSYCLQPAKNSVLWEGDKHGKGKIDKTIDNDDDKGKWNALRNALYYTPSYPGYDKNINGARETFYIGDKSKDWGIAHLALSYLYAGRPSDMSTWGSTKASDLGQVWTKAKALGDAMYSSSNGWDNAVPDGFKVFVCFQSGIQDMMVGYLDNGYIHLTKKFVNDTTFSKDNPCYDKTKLSFDVYKKDGTKVGTLKCKADGSVYVSDGSKDSTGTKLDVEEGEYYIVENSPAGSGYNGNGQKTELKKVSGGLTTEFSLTNIPQNDPTAVVLKKIDKETNESYPIEASDLEKARYEVKYYKTLDEAAVKAGSVKADRTWVFKTDEDGQIWLQYAEDYFVSGDKLYYGEDGKTPAFPIGTYQIKETVAPEGYIIDDTSYYTQVKGTNGMDEAIETYNTPISPEQVMRGSVEGLKIKNKTSVRMAGIPFVIVGKDTGEAHIIVTDANGQFNTEAVSHSTNTNKNDEAVGGTDALENCLVKDKNGKYKVSSEAIEKLTVDESKLSDKYGIWFGTNANGKKADANSKLKALPYGDYSFYELKCSKNKDCQMTGDEDDFVFHVTYEGQHVNLGTITNDVIKIHTTARSKDLASKANKDEGTHISYAAKDCKITDVVRCDGLIEGRSYTLKGVLVDAETAQPIKVDGKEVTAEKTFKARYDSVEEQPMTFGPFDASKLAGTKVVVFEELYDNETNTLASEHKDTSDEYQTIWIPKASTQAKATEGNVNAVIAKEGQKITDTIFYEKIMANDFLKEETKDAHYAAKTWLVDEDGNVVSDVIETEFTPDNEDGQISVDMTFDASKLAGKSVVVFEEIYLDGILVADHKDIEDDKQTVHVPEIGTTATGIEDSKNFNNEFNTITDVVKFENLPEGDFTMKGWAIDKDGNVVSEVITQDFNSKDCGTIGERENSGYNGTVTMQIPLNKEVTGKVVIFEELYELGTDHELAEHKKPDDENQTVYNPEIKTDASYRSGNVIHAKAEEVTDTISYKGLDVTRDYIITTSLVDKETGNVIEGTETKTDFRPTTKDGKVEVKTIIDASKMDGKEFVFFENFALKSKLEGDKTYDVAEHKDITDEEQTILVKNPEIKTKATTKNGNYIYRTIFQKITDRISYKGLIKGQKYYVTTEAIDKKTKKSVGTKTTAFVADKTDGYVDIPFHINGAKVKGSEVVVFETFEVDNLNPKDKKVVVAEHKDINDKAQTVAVKKAPITGDTQIMLFVLLGILGLAAIGVAIAIIRKKKASK